MESMDLDFLRRYAATARSRDGFGIPFLKCDGNSGAWTAGKDATDMKSRKVVADVPDTMHGFQKFENKKPVYVIGRISDGYEPPPRETLRWHNGKDPWAAVVLLPMFDPETREPFIFTSASQGGKDAVTSLIDAVVDNAELHPDDADKLPVCELSSDSYINTHGKTIHIPIFEIVAWSVRPSTARRVKPPPIAMLAIEHNEPGAEFNAPGQPILVEASAKLKRQRIAAAQGGDLDDEIPF